MSSSANKKAHSASQASNALLGRTAGHASTAVSTLRDSIVELMTAVPGRPSRTTEIMRALHLSRKTSWQVSNILKHTQPAEVIGFLPGAVGIERVTRLAIAAGVSEQLGNDVLSAYESYDKLSGDAGGRDALDKMLTASSGLSSDKAMEYHKAAFRGISYILGIQARLHISTTILYPGSKPGWYDAAAIKGYIGFESLKPDAKWMLANIGLERPIDEGEPAKRPDLRKAELRPPQAIFKNKSNGDKHLETMPLAFPFCSRPLPSINVSHLELSSFYTMSPRDQGRAGRTDCLMAYVIRNATAGLSLKNLGKKTITIGNTLNTPTEKFLCDVLLPQETWPSAWVERMTNHGFITGHSTGQEIYSKMLREGDLRIAGNERCKNIGSLLEAEPPEAWPRYQELVYSALDELGWPKGAFNVHRLQVNYPVTPSMDDLYVNLGDASADL